jgi:hypothetical protein
MDLLMKLLSYFLILFTLTVSTFAQNMEIKSSELNPSQITFGNIGNSTIADWDLKNIKPIITGLDDSKLVLTRDTLNQFVKGSTGFTTYAVTVQGNNYPLTGWNPFYYFLGQKFNLLGNGAVKEILFAAIGKQSIGTVEDSVLGLVYAGEPTQGLPTSNLGSSWILFSKVDTNSSKPVYTSIKFANPVPVTGKFVTMLVTFNGTNEYDAVILTSNLQGDGKGQKNLCMVFNNNGSLGAINFTDFWGQVGLKMQDGNPPDFDALIFPIVESGGGVEDQIVLNGITLMNVSPNPANDLAVFNMNIEIPTDITIDIVGLDGKVLLSTTQENCQQGDQQITFELNSLVSGTYYYLIRTDETKFGGKFSVVR